jgi:2-polyprenyl-3-methyl-5-hydroxy-6-metoxy-1,4-benzoquinol methylase
MATPSDAFPLVKFEVVNRPMAEARQIYEQRITDALHIHHKHQHTFALRSCPFCGADEADELEKFHGAYGVSQCRRCAGQYVNPVPGLDALLDYYNNGACNTMLQDLYRKRAAGKTSAILDDRARAILAHVRPRALEASAPVSILEVGCGSGRFLANLGRVLEQEGLRDRVRLTGVDIDRNAIASNTDAGLELHALPVEVFAAQATQKFDVVLHFELIEHLSDPASFMNSCRGLLKQDGIMVFTTPNGCGLENVASGYNGFRLIAHAIFPPMHLNAFSTQNVSVFVLRCGLKIKSITTPGKLDVDMVSLMKGELTAPAFQALAELDDASKGLFQQLLKELACSSHMMVVASA